MTEGCVHLEQTNDVHELACSITGWQQLYHQLKPGRFVGELKELWLEGIQVYSEKTNIALLQNCMIWPNAFWFGLSPCGDIDLDTTCDVLQPHSMAISSEGRQFELTIPADFFMQGIVIRRDLMMDSLSQAIQSDDLSQTLEQLDSLPISLPHKFRLRELIQQALSFSQLYTKALQMPEVRKSIQHEILDILTVSIQDALKSQHHTMADSHYHILAGKAREFVLDNPYQSITVADLVSYLKIPRRTLQHCFLKAFGITPLAYLKAIRLNAVRRELQSEESCYQTVQDAAMTWGFWHLSQFAIDYRRFFGEKPSDTLASRGRIRHIWQRQLSSACW